MAIDSDYVKSMATQLANYEVQSALTKANRNEANYKAKLTAITSLETALKTFSSSIKSLKGTNKSVLTNSATFSSEGYASATVGTAAIAGNYQFFVKQLASAHQVSIEGLSDTDVDTSGTLTIGQGSSSFNIDLSSIDSDGNGSNSLAEVAAAINGATDNSGVKATLVRSNGTVSLVLASEKTGVANAISVSTSGTSGGAFDAALTSRRELSAAKDAEVLLGGETGMLLTNATNNFDNIIDGVSLNFTKAHNTGEQPLSVTVGRDDKATKDNVQSFITAINTLLGSFDSLTASGGESSERGVLAGDSSIRSVESTLNKLLRTSFGGSSLIDFGISADRSGNLTIDAARFEKAIAANPEGLDKLFNSKDALLDSIDKNLAVYTSGTNNLMKARKESLNSMLSRVDDQFDGIQKQYDNYYARYLKQYTSMMQTMSAMEQTFGMF
ncbi:flagellar hook-associated 2 domain-containing protein [Cellvibrio sp. BR]|uniref:flagellar filament capping protein FliD n=1 Tax=Cellvibrio sp. BR TaxID=1134474 RepID=UPI00026011D3|nr:flagellar filament capping protein FliD [Cellvibrio sp. BR]EIK45723.1 flagellar hook-associated 2 domain-containing protein [Cellvibrio sp. BR]